MRRWGRIADTRMFLGFGLPDEVDLGRVRSTGRLGAAVFVDFQVELDGDGAGSAPLLPRPFLHFGLGQLLPSVRALRRLQTIRVDALGQQVERLETVARAVHQLTGLGSFRVVTVSGVAGRRMLRVVVSLVSQTGRLLLVRLDDVVQPLVSALALGRHRQFRLQSFVEKRTIRGTTSSVS